MKKFSSGLIIGLLIGLIMATATFAVASQPIKLIINGQEIACDVPTKYKRTIGARFVAEALGATVNWDATNNAVVITEEAISNTLESTVTVTPEIKETTFEGMRAIEKNGITYFSIDDYTICLSWITLFFSSDAETITFTIGSDVDKIPYTEKKILLILKVEIILMLNTIKCLRPNTAVAVIPVTIALEKSQLF